MADRGPTSKNVIYDSSKDTSMGRKRAVEFTGGVSVAERARLFGPQINKSLGLKSNKQEHTQTNRNYQQIRQESNQNSSYSAKQRSPNRNFERSNHEQQQKPPASINSHEYSTVKRTHKQQAQQPKAAYQSVQYSSPRKQNTARPSHTSVASGETYSTDDEVFHESQRRHQRRISPSRNSNYFQPIRDPLEVLYNESTFGHFQPSMSTHTTTNADGLQPFSLGNLINRIQQDYADSARPYVSSIQFIDRQQNSGNIGLDSSATHRPDYSSPPVNNLYLRPGASYHYDVIDTSQFFPTYTGPMPAENHHHHHRRHHHHHHERNSTKQKHRAHYHDQASSPIVMIDQPETSSSSPKPPSPVEEKSTVPEATDEEEEETVNTKTEDKTEEEEDDDEDDEDEEEEEEAKKPTAARPPTGLTIPGASANPRASLPTATPTSITRVAARPRQSTSSSSEESESDSDSDSDSDKRTKKSKPPVTPTTAARANVRVTPQLNSRGTTPTMRTITNKNDDPPEVSNSIKSFNTQDSTKSPGMRARFSSFTSKFRRKKS